MSYSENPPKRESGTLNKRGTGILGNSILDREKNKIEGNAILNALGMKQSVELGDGVRLGVATNRYKYWAQRLRRMTGTTSANRTRVITEILFDPETSITDRLKENI